MSDASYFTRSRCPGGLHDHVRGAALYPILKFADLDGSPYALTILILSGFHTVSRFWYGRTV
ncbi:MAG TPA: hypothetical protein VF337_07035 [Candidatus Limnocylindrales bacterium]